MLNFFIGNVEIVSNMKKMTVIFVFFGFGGIWNSGETSNKAVMDMPRTEKMNGLCDVVGFWWNM